MSLAIDIGRVTHVLLADGWHEVADQSFTVAPYEFGRAAAATSGDRGFVVLNRTDTSGIDPMGFEFIEARTNASLCGPLGSVIAVRRER
jgi:hypothetical protein